MHIFFDTETTGLTKPSSSPLQAQPYITELVAIKTDDDLNEIAMLNIMFKVPVKLEEKVKEITGITDEMLADKNPFSAHYREVAEFWTGCDKMVAHNISYDRDCLRYELMRMGKLLNFPWPIEHICTIEKTMSMKGYRLNLSALHENLFGAKFDGAHRAESDVRAMIKCYKELKVRGMV